MTTPPDPPPRDDRRERLPHLAALARAWKENALGFAEGASEPAISGTLSRVSNATPV